MMGKLVFYLNGKFVTKDKAKISVLDLGFVRGFGVFDFLRTYNGKPFKLDEHLQRLENSAKEIGLQCPPIGQRRDCAFGKQSLLPRCGIRQIVLETLKRNHLPEANIKIIVSGGVSPNQILPVGKPTLAVLVYPPPQYPKEFYTKGIKVITIPAARFLAEAKTLDYLWAVTALLKAKKQKAAEALYVNQKGEILEATTSNFFCFKGHTLITSQNGILLGITRQVVLDLAQKEFKSSLRPIKYQEIKEIDEAFITATNKEVMPVVKIDHIAVGNGKVGQKTKRIMELFKRYTQG